jgi:hypothetical protein
MVTRRWSVAVIVVSMERARIRRRPDIRQRGKDLATGCQQQDERDHQRRAHRTNQTLAASIPE